MMRNSGWTSPRRTSSGTRSTSRSRPTKLCKPRAAHTAKREAREFLLERLEAGPVNYDDLIEEAKQEGIAEKTLRRAKKELGIKSRKTRGAIDGAWTWELPPQGGRAPPKRESWPSS